MEQNWPTRPIQVVSPFTAGNASDLVGRVVFDQISRQIGQPFVIENRPGGGGTIGVNQVAKADPDGYTLLLHSSSFSAALVLHKSLPYDTLKDFTPVVPIGAQPVVLVTAPSKGFKSVADLVAAAKARPGSMNFASAGIGSTSHMAAERFRHAAGFQAQHIPFRGPTEAFAEVMSGRVDFYFLPLAPALHLVRDGKVVALAVGSDKRSPDLPKVPTISESGLRNAEYHFWTGLFVPAKTPKAIVDRLHDEAAKAVVEPAVRDRLAKMATAPLAMTVEQFGQYFRDDVASTVKLAKDVGITPVN
jgi:tripartite-type tricarboxylate transporter receptor subunit TctC